MYNSSITLALSLLFTGLVAAAPVANPYNGLGIAARDYSDLDLSDYERRDLVERGVVGDVALGAGALAAGVTYGAGKVVEGGVHLVEKAGHAIFSRRQLEERGAVGDVALGVGAVAAGTTYAAGKVVEGGVHLAEDAGRAIKKAFDRRQLVERDAVGDVALGVGAVAAGTTYAAGKAVEGGIHLAEDAGRDIKKAFNRRQLVERGAVGDVALGVGAVAAGTTYAAGKAVEGGVHLAEDAGRAIKKAFDRRQLVERGAVGDVALGVGAVAAGATYAAGEVVKGGVHLVEDAGHAIKKAFD